MGIKQKTILIAILTLMLYNCAQATFSAKAKSIFNITKKTTKASSYTAAGSALALNCIASLYILIQVINNRNLAKMKITKLALKFFTDTPKKICDNLIPVSIFALSASAIGSLYTSIVMFKNAYKTIKGHVPKKET